MAASSMRHERICPGCGEKFIAVRADKMVCSDRCYQRTTKNRHVIRDRVCKLCGTPFQVQRNQGEANKRYCSPQCSLKANRQNIISWKDEHADRFSGYWLSRVERNPSIWTEKARKQRLEIIALLGGKCIVCGATNTNWLHADYIPSMRGTGARHLRHIAFVRVHQGDFRLLCANHHYELTLTGAIEGTTIIQ